MSYCVYLKLNKLYNYLAIYVYIYIYIYIYRAGHDTHKMYNRYNYNYTLFSYNRYNYNYL